MKLPVPLIKELPIENIFELYCSINCRIFVFKSMLLKSIKFRLSLSVISDRVCIIPASVKRLGFSDIKFSMDFKKDKPAK
jgi:hypothetical protein